MAKKTSNPTRKQLETKLSGLVEKAKGLQAQGKTSAGLENELARSESMIKQNKKQGSKPFAGSSFENEYLKSDAYKKSLMGTPMVSSQMGRDYVRQADTTIANLSPITAQPEQPASQQGTVDNQKTNAMVNSGQLPESQRETTPQQPNDFLTYINEQTGQEQTLRGSAITDQNKSNLEAQGYTLATADTSNRQDSPEIVQAQKEYDDATASVNSFMSRLESMLITDKELSSEIRTIKSGYNARIDEMRQINERRKQAMETLGVRTGMRYTGGTGGIMGSILSEEERQGLMRIEQIESDKQDSILKAKKAAREQNFSLYSTLAQRAEKIQEKKAAEVKELKRVQAEQTKKLEEEKKQAEYDALITEQLAAGVTDPLKLLQALGGKVPFDQIKEMLEVIPKEEDFTLSEGQARYDSKGNLIASKAKTYAPKDSDGGYIGGVLSPEANYWATLIGKGQAKLENVPEKLRSAVVTAIATQPTEMTKANEQAYSQANTAITAIDTVLENIKEAGIIERTVGAKFPGTLARDTENTIETVQALIGFDALAEMRAASPTGGALGSITEKELRYLQSVQGSLDPLQSTKTLKTNLESIRKSFARVRAINSVNTTAEEYKKQFPDATEEELKEIRARNGVKTIQDTVNMSNKDLFNTGSWSTTSQSTSSVFEEIGL